MRKLSTITIITLVLLSTLTFAQYPDGNGTEADPWHIADANDLLYLADHPNDYNSHFILTADINLAGCDFNTAVIAPDTNTSGGFQGTEFTGTFDGNEHLIRNLTIDTNSADNYYLGLFGLTGATSEIKNLGIMDVNITSGIDSWYLGGLVGSNGSTISNCYATGVVTSESKSKYLGGLVGKNSGPISNCFAIAVINCCDRSWYIGGLVGYNSNCGINNSYAEGSVNGDSHSRYAGGLVGLNDRTTINNCYSNSSVTGGYQTDYLSGFVGYNNSGTISNCYENGDIIVGDDSENLGGLLGRNYYGEVRNCYATGSVTGGNYSDNIGGLVGENFGVIINCYAIVQ